MEIEELFWNQVEWDLLQPDGCWPWKGKTNKGYGIFAFKDDSGKWCYAKAHSFAYELEVGELDPKLVRDHLCHSPYGCRGGPTCLHRKCCNLAHILQTTHKANTAPERVASQEREQTHCKRGHELRILIELLSREISVCVEMLENRVE